MNKADSNHFMCGQQEHTILCERPLFSSGPGMKNRDTPHEVSRGYLSGREAAVILERGLTESRLGTLGS